MFTHQKILPRIPTTITLSSSYNHQDFLCRSPKFPLRFNLNSILEYQEDQLLPKIKEQKNLLKIFKGLKRIKKIHQDDLVFHKVALPVSKQKYLIKKVKRIEVLYIQDRLTSAKESPARLDLWLKHGKNLKSISYQFVSQILALDKSVVLFEREIRQCLKFLPQHRSLTALKLRLANGNRSVLESLLQFPKYPQSLKHLAIYQQRTADLYIISTDIMAAFSRLKSLESLTLSGNNLLKVTEMLLGKVPSLLNIKKLNIQVFQSKLFGPMFDLNKCQALQNLRILKISNIAERKNLSKLTNPPQLESLDIAAGIGIDGLGLISQFISLFKNSLKSLKFDILHSYQAETEEKIKGLFNEISQLEILTFFKFKIQNLSSGEVYLSSGVIENLKELFLKPVKLQSFEWKVPQISGARILLDLLKLLEGSCGTLRKLKIFHLPSMNLEKSQEIWLFNFLPRLQKIEVLYLTGLHIQEEGLWMGLVDFLKRLKSLRALGIGNVTTGFTEEWFTKPLGKILQKRGLEVLEIESSFTDQLEEEMGEPLDLKEIMKKNPALRKVSRNVRELLNTTGLK